MEVRDLKKKNFDYYGQKCTLALLILAIFGSFLPKKLGF